MPKLQELEMMARNVQYTEPTLPKSEWTEEELLNNIVYQTLNNYVLYRGVYIMLDTLPPLKMLYKNRLKSYINACDQQTQQTQQT
jgi:hypothetical protein